MIKLLNNTTTGSAGIETFQWNTSEQIWPFEKAANGSTLYCRQSDLIQLPNNGYVYWSHNTSGFNKTKVHRIEDVIYYSPSGNQAQRLTDMAAGNQWAAYVYVDETYFAFRVYLGNGSVYYGRIRCIYWK